MVNGRAAMVGYFMAYVVDLATGNCYIVTLSSSLEIEKCENLQKFMTMTCIAKGCE